MFNLNIHEEVKDALAENRGVVALESTVIAHGLPTPVNIETTLAMMAAIREQSAVPALIAIFDGQVIIGTSSALVERLADKKASIKKVSCRDIAYTIARKESGATTVSATMTIAAMAGIRVFATGGIGGVHRHVESSMDISADLITLSRRPVAVVCAGAKSILDVPKTLEMLETFGVPVVGFGTDYFPEFYSLSNNYRLHMRCDTPQSLSEVVRLHLSLGQSGLVVAQPIDEQLALPHALMEQHINEAIKKAERASVSGKDLTPFLLKEIASITKEQSIKSNCALLINNARLGAKIARLL
ncbi:MAG TPA: pseudouridine-5'-phosphate glycosidase [Myxococcota bacterium]|nr:pseudouridine-5'-phosphate glycosidase [Myxococcota bacterium]